MNPGRFYMPGYMGMRSVPMSNSMFNIANSTPRGIGLFSRITNGIRSVNWGSLLNNANRTLDVVNQAIPLVRQAGPMVNNMKSMLRIAKAFGSETNNNRNSIRNNTDANLSNINRFSNSNTNEIITEKKEIQNDNAPNFFV